MKRIASLLVIASCLAGWTAGAHADPKSSASAEKLATATFAGGCFWCMQPPFEKLEGVVRTTVGYTGGTSVNPTYRQVSAGGTGHAEAVEIVFDPARVTYEKLLEVFWRNIDPLAKNRQFCDTGDQYRTAIFVHDEAQRRAAEASLRAIESSGRLNGRIETQIVPSAPFYAAEDYHQDYHRKNPSKYAFYRWNCGRDARLEALWGGAK
jgi:peptide-methionine (S)-S-oxide reductase